MRHLKLESNRQKKPSELYIAIQLNDDETTNSNTSRPSQHHVFNDAGPRANPAKSLPCQAFRQFNGPQPLNTSNITNQYLFLKTSLATTNILRLHLLLMLSFVLCDGPLSRSISPNRRFNVASSPFNSFDDVLFLQKWKYYQNNHKS